ncbi:MAG: Gfo/Idh/MocA family oxidoreductase [Chloroflexi bacterium]|nr:Gfo/Idh/MocA family oxidoreductase [Chloroflexota bacterium]
MSEIIQAILIGAGQRGADVYGAYALRHSDQIQFVAVAEPNPGRRGRFAAQHGIPPENQFETWEHLLDRPTMGQAALVCTQDQQHTAPALSALRAGYDVLLEKPMAPTANECRQLVATAEATGRQLHICHVLRFTPHFEKMREIIQSGILGQIVNVSHRENVSWWHMAHSFVRGNWRNRAESAPMILAKCCHDLDILIWLLDSRCEHLSSVGGLLHYRPENAPDGAPQYCLDGCPAADTCPYYAPFIYVDLLPLWRGFAETAKGFPRCAAKTQQRAPGLVKALSAAIPSLRQMSDYKEWPVSVVASDPTRENLLAALKDGPYGRCVYRCDNDVVDHQVVAMQFESGVSVTLSMHGHSHLEGRTTRIEGSHATLQAHFGHGGSWIEVDKHHSDRRTRYDTSALNKSGHGGGDERLMDSFVQALWKEGAPSGATHFRSASHLTSHLTTARQSLESHLMAFAADEARVEGKVVRMSEYRLGSNE